MKARNANRKNETRTVLADVVPLETPFVLFVDPSSACNFACTFCPTGDHDLIRSIGRFQGTLQMGDFEKIISDCMDFESNIKVLRLYKDGEPLVNKRLSEMIRLAKQSNKFEMIDTTTNGSLFNPSRIDDLLSAGIDLINISIDGLDSDQMFHFTKAKVNFEEFLRNIKYLYDNKGNCKIVIKTTKEIIGNDRENEFYDRFGNICDKIYVENTSPCWPNFDVEERMGIQIKEGLYGNEIKHQTACPYLFYSITINSDMNVSACFVDWSRKLIVGNLRTEKLKSVWNSMQMNAHRQAHLSGKRKYHPICGGCGQISHCGPDSIEDNLEQIRNNYENAGLFIGLEDVINSLGYLKKIRN